MDVSRGDLVCLHLESVGRTAEGEAVPSDRSVAGICDVVVDETNRLDALSTLDRLVGEGFLETCENGGEYLRNRDSIAIERRMTTPVGGP